MTSEQEDKNYIYFGQINLMKSPTATTELGIAINNVIKNFKYDNNNNAGIVINKKPFMDDKYIQRLKNVGVIVNDHDEVIKRPSPLQRKKYKASFRKQTQKLSSIHSKDKPSNDPTPDINPTPDGGLIPPSGFVIGIQEPRVYNKRITGLRGHKLLYDTTNPQPRAAIYHSKNLNIWPVGAFTDGDMCTGVYLESPDKPKIYISSIYFPSDMDDDHIFTNPKLMDLVSQVKRERAELIIMADTNAWSEALWNMDRTNPRGRKFEDWIVRNGFAVHNKGRRYTYVRYNSQTIIDCTFSTPRISDRIQCWRVRDTVNFSDHCAIEFILKVQKPPEEKVRNFRKADWKKFVQILEDRIKLRPPLPEAGVGVDELNQWVDFLYEDIEFALDCCCKKEFPTMKIPGFGWWTKELQQQKKKVRNVKNYCKKRDLVRADQRDTNFDLSAPRYTLQESNRIRNSFRKECRRARNNNFKKWIEGRDSPKEVAGLKRVLLGKSGNEAGLMTKDGRLLDPQESLDYLATTHFPGSTDTPCRDRRTGKKTKVNINNPRAAFISVKKVKSSIASFMPHKGPGPDKLPPIVFKHFGEQALELLTRIYKASYLLEYIPDGWLDIRVVFIPKQDKKSYKDPRSYRPISLMNFILKIMEKILLWDNEETILSKKPLHKSQFGFRKGRSTDSALTSFIGKIEYVLKERGYALAVFIDIQGAYDNLSNGSIVRALKKRGCNPGYINWTLDFLKFRKVNIDYKGIQVTQFPTKGVPQGGISSPYLWNDNHDGLMQLFDDDPHVEIDCYADDSVLLVRGHDIHKMRDVMQNAINKAREWAGRHGLSFCPTKTEAMIFTRKTTTRQTPKRLKVADREIPFTASAKYLGIMLDPALRFTEHITKKVAKVTNLIHLYSLHQWASFGGLAH